ncbi:MAG: lytic murein transglycosylase [Aquimonas sp.]|jgi:glucose-6-phosphate 1-epimerase
MPSLPTCRGFAAALLIAAGASLAQATDVPAPPAIALERCLPELRSRAADSGLAAARFDALMAETEPDASVLPLLDAQPEFVTPIWDYLAALVDEQRVEDGRRLLRTHADLLDRIEVEYGIDRAYVLAVWGVESDYGQATGSRELRSALLALSCAGRRQPFFRSELIHLLKLIDAGDLAPSAERPLLGSWAGAFGQTQFMPSTYARLAVDFDGNGRRDLVDSVDDALASTANYLKRAGWRRGQAWGFEVQLPEGFRPAGGRKATAPVSTWQARGLRRGDGSTLVDASTPAERSAGLLLPAGVEGPAFLVFRNFEALHSYNAAESYALAIAHLADRIRGGEGFTRAWPTDDPGLSRAQRRELQTLLIARGHDIGEVDGRLGTRSREAIKAEQARLGWEPDGRTGQKLLQALRE